jgi:diguanylate cyclase (GGDEF)-like protein
MGAEARPDAPRASGIWRLALVAAATLIAPCVLIVLGLRGETRDVPIVAALSAVLFGLVVLRIGLLMVDVQEHRRIQDQLRSSIAEERRRARENNELLISLRERQLLSDRLFAIQRKISTRAPVQEVLDAITAGASELLRDEVVGLRLLDEADPDVMVMVSSVGLDADLDTALHRLPVGTGVGGRALVEDRICVQESYGEWDGAIAPLAAGGLRSAMAAPVHLEGRPVGSLVVATHHPGRRYSHAEQAALAALAEHVSLALNDARTVQAMHDALDQAVHQAMHDELTGLPNRACFYDRTEQALRVARRDGSGTAVLLLDLDRFKEINDTLGHRYGDRLLREIGGRIIPLLREADTLARLGGDEFCVLLPQVEDAAAACEVALRIMAGLEAPFEIDGMNMAVEASCGIAIAPTHGDTADLLLQRSDVAMYVAKRSHVDVVTYADDLDANTPDRLALLGDLRAAIATGQLSLHYQPQVALATAAVQGVEALVRWNHPRLGSLAPGAFIPIAEDSGMIRPLTSWVLSAGLDQLRRWLDDPSIVLPHDFTLAVNLSTRSLLDDDLHDEVTGALARRGIPPSMLVLEVTETAIMADPERAHRLLTDLAATGVRFAIDDFGTGYSSLAALKSLPVHHLKIDQSFVRHMHEDANDATIVRSVIDLGRTLGLRTIAEGVESADAWDQLRDLGCDAAQGYLLARAMPAPDLRAWLQLAALRREASLAH